ncbi:hypothetical protein [Mucilaginibacter sp. BT774]|nr:hypothetical protein [Mucilaginibacter sp. BT774]MDO3625874.1 hypothetical protein [Mucilaginibacter sp. BT774]
MQYVIGWYFISNGTKAFSVGFELGIPVNGVFNIGAGVLAKFEFPIT